MAILEVPVRNDLPSYNFRIVFETVTYFLWFTYNGRTSRWSFNILDIDKNPILVGIPMLTDVDLMSQFKQETLPPGVFLVFDTEGKQYNPEQFDLEERVKFLYAES